MKDLYFPSEESDWQTVSAEDAGFDRNALRAALDVARDELSSGLVVLWRGRILAEDYWELPDELAEPVQGVGEIFRAMQLGANAAGHPVEDVASTQKSVTALLALMAARRGFLRIDDPVTTHLGPGWSKAPEESEGAIAIRHLLQMTSGLGPGLEYQTPPGGVWYYNNAAYQRLMPLLEAAVGESIDDLTRSWLTGPLGMTDTHWIDRKFVYPGAPLGLATTARDLARFGLLVLARGSWGDLGRLAEADDVAELIRPSQRSNPSYGLLWWINGQAHFTRPLESDPTEGPLFRSAPSDLVVAMGTFNRRVYVVPSLELVVTRTGYARTPGMGPFDEALWTALCAAGPNARAREEPRSTPAR